ncbi:helix-turn-helix domain-containing protein [Streptomyces klenkii]
MSREVAQRPGRPLKHVPDPDHDVGRLAERLRRARARSGLTRAQVAFRIHRSTATVQRAEAGRTCPTWPVTREYAVVCDVDIEEAESLWKAARRPPGSVRLTPAPRLALVRSAADLAAALVRVHEENSRPSLRRMEERAEARAKEFTPLSRMSAWRIVNRQLLPSSVRQLCAYLVACQVPEESFPAWIRAWHGVRAYEKSLAPARPAGGAREHRWIVMAKARETMQERGLRPLDSYPGEHTPWAARCLGCGQLSRFRLASVREGAGCPVCEAHSEHSAA